MSELTLTFLADNTVMELLPDQGRVRRVSEPGRNFLAEHGFSTLVTTPGGARVLFDAGVTDQVVPHNLAHLGLDLSRDITVAALSHGHADHAGALAHLHCPIHAHPEVFGRRFLERAGELRFDLTATTLAAVRDRLVLSAEPTELVADVWTTGEIARREAWEQPRHFLRARGTALEPDDIPDDQALALVTPDGLVVVAGCAHAGIVNTVQHAREVTGVDRVHAIVGGFHLIDADQEKLTRTLAALLAFEPDWIAPNHCTGFRAMGALAQAFGDRFVYATCGHRLHFGA